MRRSLRKRTTVENYNESPLIPVDTGVLDADVLLEQGEPLGPVGPSIQAVEALEAYRELLVKAKAGKGISQFSAKILNIGVQHSCSVLGVQQPNCISQESFGNGHAVDIALESLGTTIKAGAQKLWEMIKAIFKRIKEFFTGAEAKVENAEEIIKQLKEQAANLEDQGAVLIDIKVKDLTILQQGEGVYYTEYGLDKNTDLLRIVRHYVKYPNEVFTSQYDDLEELLKEAKSGKIKNTAELLTFMEPKSAISFIERLNRKLADEENSIGNKRIVFKDLTVPSTLSAYSDIFNSELIPVREVRVSPKGASVDKTSLIGAINQMDTLLQRINGDFKDIKSDASERENTFNGSNTANDEAGLLTDVIKCYLAISTKQQHMNEMVVSYLMTTILARVKVLKYLVEEYAAA